MGKPKHNPERRAWRGRSHKKGGERVRTLADLAKDYDMDPCEECQGVGCPDCDGLGWVDKVKDRK